VDVQPPSILIGQGNTTGAFTVKGLAPGPATITASASKFANGTANVNVGIASVRIMLAPNPLNISTGTPGTLIVTLPFPAGPSGVTLNLSSIDTNVATVPDSSCKPDNR